MDSWRIRVSGTVQGVGFRPFVARLAGTDGLHGWVRNDLRGVEIALACDEPAARRFIERLRAEAPVAARIESIALSPSADAVGTFAGFFILESPTSNDAPDTAVSADLAMCPECRAEFADPANRRHRYPFTNCTQCGPRYSIVESLPYDRERTTMRAFVMCPQCAREYGDPGDRRYHAQPNACPTCGPWVRLSDGEGRELAARIEAIDAAADAIRAGRIVAVKGIGGYHLMCDALDDAAVLELRRRKRREQKPLAVMFPDLDSLHAHAELDPAARDLLTAPSAPIVLLRRRPTSTLAPAVSPANPHVGALLPYSPLHLALLDRVGRPVVATSGNLSEEPLCTDDDEARHRLGAMADFFLAHNRPIARPVDDSVVRPAQAGTILLRRARGLAPAPVCLPTGVQAPHPLLCVGGHLKNTVAIAAGDRVVLSPHIGDLANATAVDSFERTITLLASLHGGTIAQVACDAHPGYASTHYAEHLGLPVTRVQHHLAHVLACLLEHGGGPERVLGVSWDGTGYGPDGTVWGGEFIVVDRSARTARRVAHLHPFRLPGGEAAVREPRRSALGMMAALDGVDSQIVTSNTHAFGFSEREAQVIRQLLGSGRHAPLTTSAGRLFDGVAAILGLGLRSDFEGQNAMRVEFAADGAGASRPLPYVIERRASGCLTLDWRPALEAVLARRGSESAGALASAFHDMLAAAIGDIAGEVGISHVVLTGGCFQNARLLDSACTRLQASGHTPMLHRELPPNDGGIAAGQALAALWGITEVRMP